MAVKISFSPAGARSVTLAGLTETQAKSILTLLENFYIPESADTGLGSLRTALRGQYFPGSTKRSAVKISTNRNGRHAYKLG